MEKELNLEVLKYEFNGGIVEHRGCFKNILSNKPHSGKTTTLIDILVSIIHGGNEHINILFYALDTNLLEIIRLIYNAIFTGANQQNYDYFMPGEIREYCDKRNVKLFIYDKTLLVDLEKDKADVIFIDSPNRELFDKIQPKPNQYIYATSILSKGSVDV